MTGDPYCEVHGFIPCTCWPPSENIKNINPWGLVKPVELEQHKENFMEDKFVQEAINLLKVSSTNPLIKDTKKLAKIKIDVMKALMEQGINIPIA